MWTKPAVFLLVSLMSLSAAAFTPDLKALEDMTLVTRYPQGSLVSRESAEHALSEVKKAQSRLKEQADFAHRRCEENFFVNSCRDDVREERRLFQIEKEARGVIRSFNAKEEAARQAERDKKAKAKAAQRQRSDSKKAKTAQKPDAKLGTALSKRAQESKARQKAAEARKAKEAANRAKYELKQKKKAERIKAREEALAKRRAKEAAKAARGK